MSLVLLTLGLLVVATVTGLLASWAVSTGKVPDRWLIQPGRHSWARFRERLPLILLNMGMLMGVSAVALSLLEPHMPTARPPALAFAAQLLLVLAADDLWFYGLHRLIHVNPTLYRVVHRIHHRAYAPVALDYFYVHPLEWMLGAFGPVLGMLGVIAIWGELSVWTFLTYSTFRQFHELNLHSGVRGLLSRHIPLLGKVEHHDLHHAKPLSGNYASATTILDRLLQTGSARG